MLAKFPSPSLLGIAAPSLLGVTLSRGSTVGLPVVLALASVAAVAVISTRGLQAEAGFSALMEAKSETAASVIVSSDFSFIATPGWLLDGRLSSLRILEVDSGIRYQAELDAGSQNARVQCAKTQIVCCKLHIDDNISCLHTYIRVS